MYTFTPEQDALIVARWNALANDKSQLQPGQAYLILGDGFYADISKYGNCNVDVSARYSKTGNPATFYITIDEATFDV